MQIHPSTKKLIDRLYDMTLERKIEWKQGENGAVVYDTERYRVSLVGSPTEVILSSETGAELDKADHQELQNTVLDDGTTYAEYVGQLHKEAHRIARGAESAIDDVLASLAHEGDAIADAPEVIETLVDTSDVDMPPALEATVSEPGMEDLSAEQVTDAVATLAKDVSAAEAAGVSAVEDQLSAPAIEPPEVDDTPQHEETTVAGGEVPFPFSEEQPEESEVTGGEVPFPFSEEQPEETAATGGEVPFPLGETPTEEIEVTGGEVPFPLNEPPSEETTVAGGEVPFPLNEPPAPDEPTMPEPAEVESEPSYAEGETPEPDEPDVAVAEAPEVPEIQAPPASQSPAAAARAAILTGGALGMGGFGQAIAHPPPSAQAPKEETPPAETAETASAETIAAQPETPPAPPEPVTPPVPPAPSRYDPTKSFSTMPISSQPIPPLITQVDTQPAPMEVKLPTPTATQPPPLPEPPAPPPPVPTPPPAPAEPNISEINEPKPSGLFDSVANKAKAGASSVGAGVGALAGGIASRASDAADSVKQGVQDGADSLKEKSIGVIDEAGEIIRSASDAVVPPLDEGETPEETEEPPKRPSKRFNPWR